MAYQVHLTHEASVKHPLELEGAPTPTDASPKSPVLVVPPSAPAVSQLILLPLPQQHSHIPPRHPRPCPPP